MKTFIRLVEDQFKYGGKKYAHNDKKESTDILFDAFGKNWLFGTCMKYIFRYNNLQRERDLLKIACYSYIIWLKRGFHLDKKGSDKVIDTNVKIKEKNFNKFIDSVNAYNTPLFSMIEDSLAVAKNILMWWSVKSFQEISEEEVCSLFLLMYLEWEKNYKNSENHDTDTWNENKK